MFDAMCEKISGYYGTVWFKLDLEVPVQVSWEISDEFMLVAIHLGRLHV